MSLWNKDLYKRKGWAGNGLWQDEEFGFEFTMKNIVLRAVQNDFIKLSSLPIAFKKEKLISLFSSPECIDFHCYLLQSGERRMGL